MSQDITPGAPTVIRVDEVAELDKPILVSVGQEPSAPIIDEVEQRGPTA